MNTLKKIIFSCLTLSCLINLYSQTLSKETCKDMPSFLCNDPTFDTMKVNYSLPEGFRQEKYNEYFMHNEVQMKYFRGGRHLLGTVNGKVTSLDENVVLFFDIPHIVYTDPERTLENNLHLYKISSTLMKSIIKVPLNYTEIRKRVTYCSSDYAKTTFNADTVITYNFPDSVPYFQYNHCKVIMLVKINRAYIGIYCFYNDEAEKNLDKYLKPLEGMFWYRDEE